MILGTISAIIENAGLQLTIDGESAPTTKKYMFLSSYAPQAGDRVLIEEVGDSLVVLGKLTNTYADSAGGLLTDISITNHGAIYGVKKDGTLTDAHRGVQANYVWNQTHSDHTYPICFKEQSNVFYIAYSGGTWKKITTT